MEARKALTIAGTLIILSVAVAVVVPGAAGSIAAGIGVSMGIALGFLAALMRRWQRELGAVAPDASDAAPGAREDGRPPQALAG